MLRGGQALGKSFFAEAIGKLFGRHFIEVNNPRHLTGNFNRHLMDKCIVFADEGSFAPRAAQATLKNLVTSPYLVVEPKGVDLFETKNCLRVIIAGNDHRLISAGGDERRYAVLDVSDCHQEDHAYFSTLESWLNSGGTNALLHCLLNYDISQVNLRSVPRTRALLDLKISSLQPVEAWWLDKLMAGETVPGRGWSDIVPVSDLHADYTTETGFRWNRSLETQFGRRLNQLIPGLRRARRMVNSRREYIYELPPLAECRQAFERFIGDTMDWPEDEESVSPTRP